LSRTALIVAGLLVSTASNAQEEPWKFATEFYLCNFGSGDEF
jgi:hypothetical protein